MRRPEGALIGFWMCLPLIVAGLAFLIWPLSSLAAQSVRAIGGGWTLEWYREIMVQPAYREALVHSLMISVMVAGTSTALCLGPAWLLARRALKGKGVIRTLLTLPMSFSGVIVGFIAILMLGRIGFIPQVLERMTGKPWLSGMAYRFSGLVLAYLFFEIPRATHTLETAFEQFDTRLEAAAKTLGANRWQRLFWVVLPLVHPALLSTFAVTFAASLGSFGVALIITRRFSLLPLEIFHQYTGYQNPELAAAMAIMLMAMALAVHGSVRMILGRPGRVSHA